MSHVGVSDSLIEGLQRAWTQKYLGRLIVGNLKGNWETELAYRCRSLGRNSTKNNNVLTNRHVCLKVHLKYFDAMISPVVLFGSKGECFATPDGSCSCWLGSRGWQRLERRRALNER